MEGKTHLRLKRHYSLVAHSPDIVELRSGIWNPTSLTVADDAKAGHLYKLLRRLDGSTSARQIATEEGVPHAEVEGLIDHLIELDVLEQEPRNALDYYLDTYLPTIHESQAHRLSVERVIILGDPPLTEEIYRTLMMSLSEADISISIPDPKNTPAWSLLMSNDASWVSSGIQFHEALQSFEQWRGAFIVFTTRTINPIQCRKFNRVALQHRISWLHSALDGPVALIGPTFVPYRSACYECFETRVTMNMREVAAYQRYKDALARNDVISQGAPLLFGLSSLVASHTALEALNFVTTQASFTVNKALTVHLPTMEFAFNEVLRYPKCPACSPSAERDDRELYFDIRSLLDSRRA
jgi:bacteriocin biosynthesis cyclodehydratase domain-containing protein